MSTNCDGVAVPFWASLFTYQGCRWRGFSWSGDEVDGGECHSEVFGGCHGYGGSLGACEVGGVPDGVGVVCGIDVDGS
jgi:hypothetical protein